jgi:uncharacterized protein (DUF427 family)
VFPKRFYIPPADMHGDLLEPSAIHSVGPYKGTASYHSLRIAELPIQDAACFYPESLDNALKVRGHLCFLANGIVTEIDGARQPVGW